MKLHCTQNEGTENFSNNWQGAKKRKAKKDSYCINSLRNQGKMNNPINLPRNQV